MIRWTKCTILLPLLTAVSACSSPAPEPTTYLLRGETPSGNVRLERPVRAGVRRVNVAPYLTADLGIVVDTKPVEVRAAHLHQLAEPLDRGLRALLRQTISDALGFEVEGQLSERGAWDYTIDIDVQTLHGTMSGAAVIDAYYAIASHAAGGDTSEYRFSKSEPLAEEGYAALVAAEKALAQDLGTAIADALRAQMTPEDTE